MYICYVDESGVSDLSGGTSHFILLGLSIPATRWKQYDRALLDAKEAHGLAGCEIHTAWMARRYPEQERIASFDTLTADARRQAVIHERKIDAAKAAVRGDASVKSLVKNYRKSEPYVHLSYQQRQDALLAFSTVVGSWTDCVHFADAAEKSAMGAASPPGAILGTAADFAFEQLVTRFNTFLARSRGKPLGMLVYDHDQAVSTHLTERMRNFHARGTKFSGIDQIVETPLFVDSSLTAMIQVADLAAYATRRFCENGETLLFDPVYPRFDRQAGRLVGLRHYTGKRKCNCRICTDHGRR